MSRTIILKASDLETGQQAKFRSIQWTDSTGESQSAKILATDDIVLPDKGDDGYTEIKKAVIDIDINTYNSTKTLRVKRGTIKAKDVGNFAELTELSGGLPEGFEIVKDAVIDIRVVDPDASSGDPQKIQVKRADIIAKLTEYVDEDDAWEDLLVPVKYDA
jgi:hypothetical protein